MSNAEVKAILDPAIDTMRFSQQLMYIFENSPKRIHSLLQSIEDHSRKDISESNVLSIITALLDIGDELTDSDKPEFREYLINNEPAILSIIINLLLRIDREYRLPNLEKALRLGKANLLALRLIGLIEKMHGRFGGNRHYDENEIVLNDADLPTLEVIATQKIHKLIEAENFFGHRDKFTILHMWVYIQPKEAREWINEKLKDTAILIDFIRSFFIHSSSNNERPYELDENIQIYADLEEITKRVKDLLEQNVLKPDETKTANYFVAASNQLLSKSST